MRSRWTWPTPSASKPQPMRSKKCSGRSTSGSTTRWQRFSRLSETKPEEYRRATEVTYLGSVWVTWPRSAGCARVTRGVIVQVGSALAYRGIPSQAAYCGSKHALQGFLESVRSELLHERSRIKITMVQLPALNTPQFTWSRAKLPRPAAAGAADLPARGRGPRRSSGPSTIRSAN